MPPLRTVPSPGAHPPPLPGAPGFDETYRWLVDGLPARLRQPAERLPWTLGLTQSPDGRWSDFVRLHPNRELPLYAAQAPDGELGLTAAQLTHFLRAHHLGAFAWLVRDRIEDGQVEVDDQLLDLAEAFEQRWREAIIDGTGDGLLADALFRRATARWQRGTRAERKRAGGRFGAGADLRGHRPGEAGLDRRAVAGAVAGDRRPTARECVLARARSVPGRPPGHRRRDRQGARIARCAAPTFRARCTARRGRWCGRHQSSCSGPLRAAATGGFTWFATWLDAFAGAISSWRLAGDALNDELDSIGIAGEIEDAIMRGADLPAASVAAARAVAPA